MPGNLGASNKTHKQCKQLFNVIFDRRTTGTKSEMEKLQGKHNEVNTLMHHYNISNSF